MLSAHWTTPWKAGWPSIEKAGEPWEEGGASRGATHSTGSGAPMSQRRRSPSVRGNESYGMKRSVCQHDALTAFCLIEDLKNCEEKIKRIENNEHVGIILSIPGQTQRKHNTY